MRACFSDTHNVAEGAAGAGLAAILREREAVAGRRIGFVLSGGNVDAATFARVLAAGWRLLQPVRLRGSPSGPVPIRGRRR